MNYLPIIFAANAGPFAEMQVWQFVLYILAALIVGLLIGYFVARRVIKKELEKRPPINERMIRAMFMSMGRKPSEAQIRAVMRNVEKNKDL